jgi:hypothetical protein
MIDPSGNVQTRGMPYEKGQGASSEEDSCFICGKQVGANWFARIHERSRKVYLCGTACAFKYFDMAIQSNRPHHENGVGLVDDNGCDKGENPSRSFS